MRTRTIWLVALVAALLLVNAGVVAAKKPPTPPPTPADTGTIYYASDYTDANGETTWVTYGAAPDRSDTMPLVNSGLGVPSHTLHWCTADQADERWFLEVRQVGTATYPNGVYRHELFAVCENGEPVQLTDAANVEPDHTVPASQGSQPLIWHPRPQWADGDTMVSYVAKRWSSGAVVEWGFYALAVDADDLDGHTAAAPTWIDVEVDRRVADGDTWSGGRVNAIHAWAPDGASFIYSSYLSTGRTLMRADHDATLDTWDTTELASSGIAQCWAPVANRILFEGSGGVVTMDPYDPTDFTVTSIAGSSSKRASSYVSTPRWSPSGTHIAYQLTTTTWKGVTTQDVYVAEADGSEPMNLTDGTSAYAELLGWGDD